MEKKLTSTSFWDNYWKNCKIPSIVNENFSFERCLAREFRKNLGFDLKNKSIVEILSLIHI